MSRCPSGRYRPRILVRIELWERRYRDSALPVDQGEQGVTEEQPLAHGNEIESRIPVDDSMIDPELLAEPTPPAPRRIIANSEPPPSIPPSTILSDDDEPSSSSSSEDEAEKDEGDEDGKWKLWLVFLLILTLIKQIGRRKLNVRGNPHDFSALNL